MKRDYKLFINDIRESVAQIEEYLKGISREQFMKNKMLQDAVVRRLEIIGEASKNIPPALKEKNKQVPWIELSQFRNLMAHSYYEVSLNKILDTLNRRLPTIKEGLKKIKLV